MIKEKILILGSGGLRIGQAGEFDYSGSQAIKACKEEKIKTILINPNIATIQTDENMADEVYLQPLQIQPTERIIEKEKPTAILLGFGGQTALNLGLALHENNILSKYNVRVLGTSIDTIRTTEDRELFKEKLKEIDVKTARSIAVTTVKDALKAAKIISYPIMMRSAFSLGGLGSGKINNSKELSKKAKEALNGAPQILIEEYLRKWKEIEYEIVRDHKNNTITVCNMENMDSMGIHTGESIVVAPSQTLNNDEYHYLREIAIKVARHLEIIGECNIQYAFNPENGDYRVIEVNARLSRSSALASKATGYPLAFVATKIALGYSLPEIKNNVTQKTSAFFEPALDYIVVKIPRWDIHKLQAADKSIGSEMKSVGEVMAIGRTFPEAIQKGVRMLNNGACGVHDSLNHFKNPNKEIKIATYRRLFALYASLKNGTSVEKLHELSGINPWFIYQLQDILEVENKLSSTPLTTELLKQAKQFGFSDLGIAKITKNKEETIRQQRIKEKIIPVIKQIDTLAGEFEVYTNYLYSTYHGSVNDLLPSKKSGIIILGSGPYCIGSSVEFDWCAVNTSRSIRKLQIPTFIINSNPETVSTDFDESDRLYFEELTCERVRDIADFENHKGIIVSVGGQIANNIAIPLEKHGYTLLGSPANSIDLAENRKRFSSLLNSLNIDQPSWISANSIKEAKQFACDVGFPVIVRPSYVLSGSAMKTIWNEKELEKFLKEATSLSPDKPVVLSQFIVNAKELEIDGVAKNGKIIIEAISEHIENAGVHSGDATIVLPPQRLYLETIRITKQISRQIVRALNLSGPFNIQFIAKDNSIKVIECNARASRSLPFVSKVTNHNFIEIASQLLIDTYQTKPYQTLDLNYVGIKTPQFSYNRLKGANPVANVEMASTGEVACLGENYLNAFYNSWLATEQSISQKTILFSIGGKLKKQKLLEPIRILEEQGWEIYSTEGTHDFLYRNGIASTFLYKTAALYEPNVRTAITEKKVSLIINIPKSKGNHTYTDGYTLRRLAIDNHIPLITNLQITQTFLLCLNNLYTKKLPIKSVREYTQKTH
jgi:carbamoyl-phosphate synthase large subunit